MKNVTIILLILLGLSSQAQNWEFNIGSGANITFIPDFNAELYIANDGLVIPNLISLANSVSPIIILISVLY